MTKNTKLVDICQDCPFQGSKQVPGYGNSEAKIFIVGEAPGYVEEMEGFPFIGPSGKVLNRCLQEAGIDREDVYVSNVVQCRPPENETPESLVVKHCLPHLREEIEAVKPDVLVLCGGVAVRALAKKTPVSIWRGNVLRTPHGLAVCTWHPAYIGRNIGYMPDLIEDLILARKISSREKIKIRYSVIRTISGLEKVLSGIPKRSLFFADLETTGLSPYKANTKILLMSFTAGADGKAYVLPVDHPGAPWKNGERANLRSLLDNFFAETKPRVVGQNWKFDIKWFWQKMGINPGIWADTMLMSYALDERPGHHSLKNLCWTYANSIAGYDKGLDIYLKEHKLGMGDLEYVPIKILEPYSAGDAIATREVFYKIHKDLAEEDLVPFAKWLSRCSIAVAGIEHAGAQIDKKQLNHLTAKYSDRLQEIHTEICSHPVVQQWEEAVINQALEEATELAKEKAEQKKANTGKDVPPRKINEDKIRKDKQFNPGSPTQLGDLLFNHSLGLQLPVMTRTAKKHAPAVSQEALEKLKDRDQTGIIELLLEGAKTSKILGTYLIPYHEHSDTEDGRVHTSFSLHGTVSGRLACRQPNLQNIPSRDAELAKDIKSLFISRWKGGKILEADYAQMEIRVLQMYAQDPSLGKILSSGGDPHRLVAATMYDCKPEEIVKKQRDCAKDAHFALIYGAGAKTVAHLVDSTPEEIEGLLMEYFKKFRGVGVYIKKSKSLLYSDGQVPSLFGRIRRLRSVVSENIGSRMEAERQAVNARIQASASDLTLSAVTFLGKLLKKYKLNSLIINTVHDSALLDVYPGEEGQVVVLVQKAFTRPVAVLKHIFPELDTDWLTVPLRIDIKIGSSWAKAKAKAKEVVI